MCECFPNRIQRGVMPARLRAWNGLVSWIKLLLAIQVILQFSTTQASGDGAVFPPQYARVVEIPNQQAFIQFVNGVERLVIETSYAGPATNLAWVVPLPAPAQITSVSDDFFVKLQKAFEPRLLHYVRHYWVGVLLLIGLGFLGIRALKDEVSWTTDLPWCVGLALGAGIVGKHWSVGVLFLVLTLYLRIFARSPKNLGITLIVGVVIAGYATLISAVSPLQLMSTMGDDGSSPPEVKALAVNVVSVQHAGLFESTTIQSKDPDALEQWLGKNGFQVNADAKPVIAHYVAQGWVFVASKIRHPSAGTAPVALHPLAFTFASKKPVYPMALTATVSKSLLIDLFIAGKSRASAPHFRAVRCDRVFGQYEPGRGFGPTWLHIDDALELTGNSEVGTKLTARLNPAQMKSDVEISWTPYWAKGATVYSYYGATICTLNIIAPLAMIGILLINASRCGRLFTSEDVGRWCQRFVIGVVLLGIVIFCWFPKTEVEVVGGPNISSRED